MWELPTPKTWALGPMARIFYDGSGRVWSTVEQSNRTGYHLCDQGYGIGYSIEVVHCITERRYDLNSHPISEWDYFKVHVAWKGMPMAASHNMHVDAYPSGTVTYH